MAGTRFDESWCVGPICEFRFPATSPPADRSDGAGVNPSCQVLLGELSSHETLLMHLGMSGSFRIGKTIATTAPPAVTIMSSSTWRQAPSSPSTIHGGSVSWTWCQRANWRVILPSGCSGPSPCPRRSTLGRWRRHAGKEDIAQGHLLDQRMVAGLGNIYVVEALHRAGLSPQRQASTIATASGLPRPTAYRWRRPSSRYSSKRSIACQRRHRASRFRVYDREGDVRRPAAAANQAPHSGGPGLRFIVPCVRRRESEVDRSEVDRSVVLRSPFCVRRAVRLLRSLFPVHRSTLEPRNTNPRRTRPSNGERRTENDRVRPPRAKPQSNRTSPLRVAMRTASVRLVTPSFSNR